MCESQHETIGAEWPPNSMDEANRLVEHVQSHVRCLLASGDPVTPRDVEQAVISAIMPTYPTARDVSVTAMRDATGEVTGWAAEATVTMGPGDVQIRPIVRAVGDEPFGRSAFAKLVIDDGTGALRPAIGVDWGVSMRPIAPPDPPWLIRLNGAGSSVLLAASASQFAHQGPARILVVGCPDETPGALADRIARPPGAVVDVATVGSIFQPQSWNYNLVVHVGEVSAAFSRRCPRAFEISRDGIVSWPEVGSIPAAVRRDGDGDANALVRFGADFMQLRGGNALVISREITKATSIVAAVCCELERRGERGLVWRQEHLELPCEPGGPRQTMRALFIGDKAFIPIRLNMVLFDGVMAELDDAERQWFAVRIGGRAVPGTRLIDRTGDVTADWSGRTPPITGGSGLTGGALVGVDWGAAKSHSCVATYDDAGSLRSVEFDPAEFDPAAPDGFDGLRRHFAELSPSTLDVDALKGGPLTRESYLAGTSDIPIRRFTWKQPKVLDWRARAAANAVVAAGTCLAAIELAPSNKDMEFARYFEFLNTIGWGSGGTKTNLEAIGNGADEGELLAAWFASSDVDEHERREASRRRGLTLAANLGAKPYPTAAEAIARVVDGQTETVAARELPEMYARLRAGLMVGGLTGDGGFVPYEDGAHDDMDGGVPIRVRFDRERADAERRRARDPFALARFARLELADLIGFVASPQDA